MAKLRRSILVVTFDSNWLVAKTGHNLPRFVRCGYLVLTGLTPNSEIHHDSEIHPDSQLPTEIHYSEIHHHLHRVDSTGAPAD